MARWQREGGGNEAADTREAAEKDETREEIVGDVEAVALALEDSGTIRWSLRAALLL